MNIHHKTHEVATVDPQAIATELEGVLVDIQGLTILTGFLLAEHWKDQPAEVLYGLNSITSVMEREVKRSMDLTEILSDFIPK